MSNKLQILQVISSSATSGAERHVLDLSAELTRQGHEVHLLCPTEGWLTEEARKLGLHVTIKSMRGFGWWQTIGFITKQSMRRRVDIIHTHLTRAAYIGNVAGLVAHRPVITSVHIANNDNIYRRLAHGRNRLVAVSSFVSGMLHGKGVPIRHIDVIYNGTDFLDQPLHVGQSIKQEFGISEKKKLVGVVGKLCLAKGHLEFISAFKRVLAVEPDAHAVLVGKLEDGFAEQFESALAKSGIADSVTITGVRTDISRFLDSFEFTVMPSHMETFGIAAIEAMARSKPVIVTRVGALPEVVQHRHTGLVVSLDPVELADAMLRLLRNDSERLKMGEEARIMVEERFSAVVMARLFERSYRNALAGSLEPGVFSEPAFLASNSS